MNDPYANDPYGPGSRSGRSRERRARGRRRRRRLLFGLVRGVFWALLLLGVFILGVGFGNVASRTEGGGGRVTVDHSAPAITYTQPTTTVTRTETVTRTVTRGAPRSGGGDR